LTNPEKEHILQLTNERNELIMMEDGFYYYFPSGGGGFSAHNLRILAEILDEKNAAWEKQIHDDFEYRRRKTGS